MSNLDDIAGYNELVPSERIKQEIKELFLKLIGEVKKYPGQYDVEYHKGRHNALDQLRKKVEEL